jgi:hypothetical protein
LSGASDYAPALSGVGTPSQEGAALRKPSITSSIPTACLAVAILVALVGAAAAQQATIFIFENSEPGKLPVGFVAGQTGPGAPGRWELVADPTAPSGMFVVGQLDAAKIADRSALLMLDAVKAKNLSLSVRFKAIGGEADRTAGLVARHRDDNNYYLVSADVLAANVRLYHVVDGVRAEIGSAPAKVTADEWHSLGLVAVGKDFQVNFDGETLFEVEDDAIGEAGKVGLSTEADSITYFDDLSIQPAN